MTVVSYASIGCKKAMKIGLAAVFWNRFKPSKCKTMAKMAVARIKLLRNKREVVIRQMRRDIAVLLESKQDATARIRVEHVIREQNIMSANELIELFCDLIVARLPIITKQRDCPADLKEGICSVIFAAPRCSEIPELTTLQDVFKKKYGKDFVSAATDLRPNAGVNRLLVEKLSVRTPSGEVKLKVLKEIAKEYNVDWDNSESETELLKPPEERIGGPSTFVGATSLPTTTTTPHQSFNQNSQNTKLQSDVGDGNAYYGDSASAAAEYAAESAKKAIAAAEVAAYLAAKERSESESDLYQSSSQIQKSMKRRSSEQSRHYQHMSKNNLDDDDDKRKVHRRHSYNNNVQLRQSAIKSDESDYYDEETEPSNHVNMKKKNNLDQVSSKSDESEYDEEIEMEGKGGVSGDYDTRKVVVHRRQSYNNVHRRRDQVSFDESEYDDEEREMEGKRAVNRRHSYNVQSTRSGIKFDESDYADEEEEEDDSAVEEVPRGGNRPPPPPPSRPAPPAPPAKHVKEDLVHRKVPPDFETLAARFEALKSRKSK